MRYSSQILSILHYGSKKLGVTGLFVWVSTVNVEDGLLWFWIGSHADYDKLINA